jgi:phage terminase large subunit-like protein
MIPVREIRPRRLDKSRGNRNIEWIEKYCRVPEGKDVGKKVKLRSWQKRELSRIYDNPAGTRRAILSFARKNGKSSLATFILLLHLVGPEAEEHPNSQIYSAAQSREQASLVFALAAKIIRLNRDLADAVQIKEGTKELICLELGVKYRALSAEASTAYGLSPRLIIHDELGQVRGPRSQLYEALETATGAHEDPLSIVISTQAATDADLLSILIDDALAGHDPHVVCSLYTAPIEDDPFHTDTIKKANPAYGEFLSSSEVLAMAADAKRMPAREAEYRNLILNQRVEVSNPFIAPAVWKDCGGEVGSLADAEVFGGLDLSEVADLTALVLIARLKDGKWHVRPTFWLPEVGIREKSISDRVPYDMWAKEGLLTLTPGKTISYEYVANHIVKDLFPSLRIKKIGFDRWNMKHLQPWLEKAGMKEEVIKDKFVEFGQGYASMSPALRDLEQVLLDGKMTHPNHPILSLCVSNTIIARDDAGNRKPSKKRSTGRIDGLVALTMACGVAPIKSNIIDINALLG